MIKKGNKPVLFFYVSCKLQIWEIALVIINIKTHNRECENTMFVPPPPHDLSRNP
jgi:hypothetical protein